VVEDLTTVTWLAVGGRWFAYACTLWIGGTVIAELLLVRAAVDVGPLGRRLAGPALGVAATLVALRTGLLWAQAWLLFALDEPVTSDLVRLVATRTSWGAGWICQLVAAIVALIGFALRRAGVPIGRSVAALGCAGAVLSVPLTGHAVEQGWLSVPAGAQMLHVASATAWIGTLAVLAGLVLRLGTATAHDQVARAIHRFSPLALAASATLVLSGATTSWLYVGELSALWTTAYGRALALKILLFAATASVGYVNWRRVRPHLGAGAGTERLRRSVAIELTWATVLLLVTAALVARPMPMR
jgi:putative copper export protein